MPIHYPDPREARLPPSYFEHAGGIASKIREPTPQELSRKIEVIRNSLPKEFISPYDRENARDPNVEAIWNAARF